MESENMGTVACYAELLNRCWDKDPDKRPSALEIYETIINWKNDIKILSEFRNSDKEMVIENNQSDVIIDNISIYSSKIISLIDQQLLNCGISDNKINVENVKMDIEV
ncbi:kinase-like protein [Gigaspora margarita]|uniref:Kinase-like protein n=1 Tax=Gigaspora margarita TaxID=4874 RepID=A0A8H3X8N1_GIGMA|nr:kinase-like protein [Gigaspora margarita]